MGVCLAYYTLACDQALMAGVGGRKTRAFSFLQPLPLEQSAVILVYLSLITLVVRYLCQQNSTNQCLNQTDDREFNLPYFSVSYYSARVSFPYSEHNLRIKISHNNYRNNCSWDDPPNRSDVTKSIWPSWDTLFGFNLL